MPVTAKCPTCHATQRKPADYGATLECDSCGELFTVPAFVVLPVPVPPPAPPPEAAFEFDKTTDPDDYEDRPRPTRRKLTHTEKDATWGNVAYYRAILGLVAVASVVGFGIIYGCARNASRRPARSTPTCSLTSPTSRGPIPSSRHSRSRPRRRNPTRTADWPRSRRR